MVLKKINKPLACCALCYGMLVGSVNAAEIKTNMARMQAMDKITGRVSEIDVPVNGEVVFGSFSIVVRACATKPPEETPENFAFVDVVDNYNTGKPVNIFKGWMLSSSPALNAVEHPIYDVWLLKCYDGEIGNKKLLNSEELIKRDEIIKFVAQDNKFNNIEAIIPESTKIIEPIAEEENRELKEMPVATMEPSIVIEQPIEDGAPKSILNIGEKPVAEAVLNDENIVDAVVKELQEKQTDKPTTIVKPESVEVVDIEPLVVVEDNVKNQEPLLNIEDPIKDTEVLVKTETPEVSSDDILVEDIPENMENPAVSTEDEQIIKLEEEAEEDGFELNTEALKN